MNKTDNAKLDEKGEIVFPEMAPRFPLKMLQDEAQKVMKQLNELNEMIKIGEELIKNKEVKTPEPVIVESGVPLT